MFLPLLALQYLNILNYFCRKTECQFRRLGCPWRGPHHEASIHAAECPHPNRSGRELLPLLENLDKKSDAQEEIFKQLVGLLSFEKITFNGVFI